MASALLEVVVGFFRYSVSTTSRDVKGTGWFVSGVIDFRLETLIIPKYLPEGWRFQMSLFSLRTES